MRLLLFSCIGANIVEQNGIEETERCSVVSGSDFVFVAWSVEDITNHFN